MTPYDDAVTAGSCKACHKVFYEKNFANCKRAKRNEISERNVSINIPQNCGIDHMCCCVCATAVSFDRRKNIRVENSLVLKTLAHEITVNGEEEFENYQSR